MANNRLTTLPDEVFTTARKIQELDLSLNNFSEVPQKLWKGLAQLRQLNLSHNPLRALRANSFGDLPLLEDVDITGLTALTDLDIRTLENNM